MAEIEAGSERCLMITVKDIYDETSVTHMFIEEDECELDLHEIFEVLATMGFGMVC